MITQKIIDHVFLRNNLINYEYELQKGSRIVDVSPMLPTRIQFYPQPPENFPDSNSLRSHVYLELYFVQRPFTSQYQFNAAERLGNRLLTPLAESIALIADKTGRVPTFAKVIAKIFLIFTATIGLVGAALKATGEYFNPNKANYQAARQTVIDLRKARMELESTNKKIQAELERRAKTKIDQHEHQSKMQSLNATRETCVASVESAVNAFNKATNRLHGRSQEVSDLLSDDISLDVKTLILE